MTAMLLNTRMDIKEIRRINLNNLLKDYRTVREFATLTGSSEVHISQMKTGSRAMGDAVARRIETTLGKEHGWMDSIHDVESAGQAGEMPGNVSQDIIDLAMTLASQPQENIDALKAALTLARIKVDLPANVVQLPNEAMIITDPKEKSLINGFRSVNAIGQQMIDTVVRAAKDSYPAQQTTKDRQKNHNH
jgi:hypothetical protein